VNCREASIQISLHVGDDLPSAEVPTLEEHLEGCAVCQVEYESYASARDALQMLKGESMGTTNLWGDLEAQLDAATAETGGGKRWYSRPVWASIAAAMVLTVTAQFWMPFGSATDVANTVANSTGSNALTSINVGIGQPGVGPDAIEDEGPQSEPASYDDFRELMRGRQDQSSLEDLDDPMIAAPASRRSF
jgi:hypothetical protein